MSLFDSLADNSSTASGSAAALGGEEDAAFELSLFDDQTRTLSQVSDLAIPFGSIFLFVLIPLIVLTLFCFIQVSSKRLAESCESAAGPFAACNGKCVYFSVSGARLLVIIDYLCPLP